MIVDIQTLPSVIQLLFKLSYSDVKVWYYTSHHFRRKSSAIFFYHLFPSPHVSISVTSYRLLLTFFGRIREICQEVEGAFAWNTILDQSIKCVCGSPVSFNDYRLGAEQTSSARLWQLEASLRQFCFERLTLRVAQGVVWARRGKDPFGRCSRESLLLTRDFELVSLARVAALLRSCLF